MGNYVVRYKHACIWTYEFECYNFLMENGTTNNWKRPDLWTPTFATAQDCRDFINKTLIPWAKEWYEYTLTKEHDEEVKKIWKQDGTRIIRHRKQEARQFLIWCRRARPYKIKKDPHY